MFVYHVYYSFKLGLLSEQPQRVLIIRDSLPRLALHLWPLCGSSNRVWCSDQPGQAKDTYVVQQFIMLQHTQKLKSFEYEAVCQRLASPGAEPIWGGVFLLLILVLSQSGEAVFLLLILVLSQSGEAVFLLLIPVLSQSGEAVFLLLILVLSQSGEAVFLLLILAPFSGMEGPYRLAALSLICLQVWCQSRPCR